MTRFLLVTDLDDTLVGDDDALRQLDRFLAAAKSRHGSRVVYSTGRSLTLYRELAADRCLPPPDALVTAVGTEIYFESGDAIPDPAWSGQLAGGWDRQQVVAAASGFADLLAQPASEQRPFKVSFFVAAQAAAEILPALQAALAARSQSTQLVYSGNRHLDILPAGAGKGLAMQYLRRLWGFEAAQTVACGDSGNDIALFGVGDERGIVVGNARPELFDWVRLNPADRLYLARAHRAAGIVEGLRHFGFLGGDDNA
jgi:sucrose-6F-phosphate phosphohydrolase